MSTSPSPSTQVHLHEAPTSNNENKSVSASGSDAPAADAVRAQEPEGPAAPSTTSAVSGDKNGDAASAGTTGQLGGLDKPAAASDNAGKEDAKVTVTGPEPTSRVQTPAAKATDDKAKVDGSPSLPAAHGPRIPTPSSRTSTPPLHATAAGKKKFSSVSVTKEFLSKAASPAPAAAKLVRPVAAAAPPQTHSKLLSTKLTTVPSSKQSTSPKPPATTTSSATSSPWAKPAVSLPEGNAQLQHPMPTRGGNVPNVAMGSGQGIGSAARRAWGNVSSGKKMGHLSRDFPTASEVAEGKRAAMLSAQAVAQAEAAHNQAILQGLNEFTHLEPNTHRWDEEEDDDDPIDFGDGRTFPHDPEDDPVSKQDRFADDFDRSWPRSSTSPQRPGKIDSSRVLFNASSNRLEPHAGRQLPHSQQGPPARIISRDGPQHGERPLPPHLADSGGAQSGRMLPPHMASQGAHQPHANAGPPPSRSSWRSGPEREAPHHQQQHPMPPQRGSGLSPLAQRAPLPRSQPPHAAPPAVGSAPAHAPAPASAPAPAPAVSMPVEPVSGETQAAEMHSAAEKARMRRQQEEAEREAAAERARKKAQELAERFGSKSSTTSSKPPLPSQPTQAAPPPGLSGKPAPPPGLGHAGGAPVTIASRPPAGEPAQSPIGQGTHLPTVSEAHPADRATSWRRVGPVVSPPQMDDVRGKNRRRSSDHHQQRPDISRDSRRGSARDVPMANQRVPRDAPPHVGDHFPPSVSSMPHKPKSPAPEPEIAAPTPHSSKKEANFDAMLARLQAAMQQTRLSPVVGEEKDEHEHIAAREAALKELHESTTHEPPVEQNQPKLAPRSVTYPHLPPDYFDATQTGLPRSPPPAWRQYTVKIPKPARATLGSIPRWRLKGFDSFPYVPKGFLQTYDPPIAYLPAFSLVSDVLLPQPIGRRFARHAPTGPIVSISPRTLQPFEKKQKRRATLEARPTEISKPAPTAEAVQNEASLMATTDNVLKSMKDKEQLFMDKPPSQSAVRFMVSSEHEGDSLLDEVNKMSLEHIGELEDKSAKPELAQRRPNTPPKPTAQPSTSPSKVAPGPWAKGALSYNLASPAARVAPPHEHLKSVWDSPADTKPKATPSTQPQSSVPSQPDTPLYPSLTAPSTASESSLKPGGYGQSSSSAFGMRSGVGGSFQYPTMNSGATSPADGGGMGMQYGLMGRNGGANASPAGTNGFQQGLWAPSFGSPMTSAGYGFNSASATPGKNALHDNKSPQMQFAGNNGAGKDFSGDYRYSNQQGSYQYPQQFRQQQNMYGHVGYGGHGGHGHAHGGHGFGQQMANRGSHGHAGGRFPNHMEQGVQGVMNGVSGVDYQMAYDPSYYQGQYGYGAGVGGVGGVGGGVGGVGGLQQQQRGGANGRKLW